MTTNVFTFVGRLCTVVPGHVCRLVWDVGKVSWPGY